MSEPTANVISDLPPRLKEDLTGAELFELQFGAGAGSSLHTDLDAIAWFAVGKVQSGSGIRKLEAGGVATMESGGADVVTVTASTTLGLAHLNRAVLATSASALTLTIPQQSAVEWPNGAQIEGFQGGAGAVSVVAGAGVTLRRNTKLGVTTDGQWAPFGIKRIGLNTWVYFGQLVSA